MINPSDSEPVEYIYTDAHMTEGLRKALIEKYGHIPDLANMVPVDDDRPTEEQLRAENLAMQDVPDDELDDDEYYGRHGYSRTAPTCDDPECFMCD